MANSDYGYSSYSSLYSFRYEEVVVLHFHAEFDEHVVYFAERHLDNSEVGQALVT